METIINWISQPWSPVVGGIMIGLTVPLLLLLTGKTFGISSSFRHMNSMCSPRTRLPYLKDSNWRQNTWQLLLVLGVVLGAYIGNNWLSETPLMFLPEEFVSVSGAVRLLIGGVLVGFGTRWANGCTSGHTITGISNLQWTSVVATIFFFVGGLISTWLIIDRFL